jgi:hypothetical protein
VVKDGLLRAGKSREESAPRIRDSAARSGAWISMFASLAILLEIWHGCGAGPAPGKGGSKS